MLSFIFTYISFLKHETIETYAPAFLSHNNSPVATVNGVEILTNLFALHIYVQNQVQEYLNETSVVENAITPRILKGFFFQKVKFLCFPFFC